MKRKWEDWLKRAGALLLLAAILAQTAGSYVYAGEEMHITEDQPERKEGENTEETENINVTEDEPESRITDSDAPDPDKIQEEEQEQYHFQDGDVKSVQEWMKLYLPGGYQDIRTMDEGWWQQLYDYERDLAEFIRDSLVDLDPHVYSGQSIDEILAILEEGVSIEAFFEGTVFQDLELSDLLTLQTEGLTLDDVYEMQTFSLTVGTLEPGDETAGISVTPTGYSGTGHGTIYKITLGGNPALCMSMGKHARNGYRYFVGEGECERRNDGIGYLIGYATLSGKFYTVVQIAAWLYLESKSLSRTQVITRAASMLNTSAEEAENMADLVWDYYNNACHSTNIYYVFRSPNSNSQILGSRSIPSGTPWQPGTGGGDETENPPVEPEFDSVEDSVSVSYQVRVQKKDWQTGVGLGGCVIDIFENGTKAGTVTTNSNGEASWQTSKSASFQAEYCSNYEDLTPEQKAAVSECTSRREALEKLEAEKKAFAAVSYTYSTREVTAPVGYVWQANEKSQSISGSGTANLTLTNERTLGSVELIKYDTESECGTPQGEAILDGAVYGIYAAENIVHADGRTGVLFRKDELVSTAVVGRSPRQNGDGYILNTDGTRHIETPGGTVAYENTPGRTVFGDLELGKYYIREITPAQGYMLDETRYDVTFTYKNQTTRVEVRSEAAKDAENTLTVDDASGSHAVYSGDYVIKQGVQFVKTSDNAYQTELSAIEGAGFSVYLIRDLLGVKDGTITPVNGLWGSDDIMAFYEYDFAGEQRAVLYKRTGQEQWTDGDRKWLVPAGEGGRYQTAEMFTDKDGRIETPELPYGTYVIVETTTPEHHVMAKPFIVHISQDGGVLYTDMSKQTIAKTYSPEEAVRYGDRKGTKEREGRALQKQRIINNTITTAYLRIVKADEEFLLEPGAYVKPEELLRGTVLKEEAEYRLRCLTEELNGESLKALNWKTDAQGYLSYYDPAGKVLLGTAENPFTTSFLRKDDKIVDCYITLPRELPVGSYELEELRAPEGYVVNGSEEAVRDTSGGRINGYEIVDAPREKTVFTIENGSVYPDGQMGVSKYALRDSHGNLVVTALQKNQEQKGIIEIYKHGEQLSGAGEDTMTLLDKLAAEPFRYLKLQETAEHRDAVFHYEDAPVEGARFQIVAAEDIYSQELDPACMEEYGIDPEAYRIWKKGDVAAEISTDRNGYAYMSGLYIGKYKIRETVAGSGFVLNTREEEFSITPQKQTVSFDIRNVDYKNERQRLKIQVVKKDRESGRNLSGAVYGLYAAEDICTGIEYSEEKEAWVIREEREVLFPEGTLIATCMTDSEGNGIFDEDLPLGKYELRELEAPVGYLNSEESVEVDGSYESEKGGQDVPVQEHVIVLENQITRVRFQKLDQTNGNELAGALLEVWELPMTEETVSGFRSADLKAGGNAEVMKDSWISTGPARMIHQTEGLQLGRIYAFREARPAPGYVTAEDIYFRLEQVRDEDGKLTDQVEVYQMAGPEEHSKAEAPASDAEILVMEDDITKVQISKRDITSKEELPGAVLELYDEQGTLLNTWTSTDTPYYIERLPIGTYRLVEKKAPEGYSYAEDVIFQVLDTEEIQTVVMEDDVEKEETPKKPPEETPEEPDSPKQPKHPKERSRNVPKGPTQIVYAPELGDAASAAGYIFLILLAAASGIVCWRRRNNR